jgi:hypothetical protein
MEIIFDVLNEIKRRVIEDRDVFARNGRSVKGHNRTIFLIEEMIQEGKEELGRKADSNA